MMGIERSYSDAMALFTENIDVQGLAWWELKEVTMILWLFYNTYRSTFWKARCCYRRWKREIESQKSNNLPESQCVYGRVKELRRSNTKIAAATKTMALATELKVALSLLLLRVPVLWLLTLNYRPQWLTVACFESQNLHETKLIKFCAVQNLHESKICR